MLSDFKELNNCFYFSGKKDVKAGKGGRARGTQRGNPSKKQLDDQYRIKVKRTSPSFSHNYNFEDDVDGDNDDDDDDDDDSDFNPGMKLIDTLSDVTSNEQPLLNKQ